jgi:trigonelline permease
MTATHLGEIMQSQSVVEKHTIGYVPPSDRHGKVRDLFTLWFGTNIAPLPVVTGAAGVTVFGLDLFWCVIAIIVGHLVGGVFMALHSAQGPQMGIPQMIQSRGQFGSYGALIVVVIAAVMYLAFFASNIVLAGQSLHGIVEAVPVSVGIILGVLGSGLICVIGYRFIHALNKIATVVLGIGIVVGIAAIFTRGVPATFWTQGGYTTAGFLATVSLGALWQIAFAPYVSDYSRYLPASVGVRDTFFATYLGCSLGSILPFVFGAVVALAMTPGDDVMAGVDETTGVLGPMLLVLFLVSVISHNALNLYGTVLSLITCGQTFVTRWIPAARTRVVLSAAVMIVSAYFAIGVSGDFISHFVDIVLALLVVLVPWTAINLIDFYLIHRGNYDLDSIFAPDGGIYGRFNNKAIVAYVIGIVVQIPFMNTPLYAGPVPAHFGGADLSWIIGLLATGPIYYAMAHRTALAPSELRPVNA